MHFLLVGPGALGCLLSSVITKGLAATGDRLTLLDHNEERATLLCRQGIIYALGDGSRIFPVAATSDPGRLDPVDVVLLCVKSYDVPASLAFCRPLLTENTLLIFLQNGISHLALVDQIGRATAAFGTTTEGATLLAPGHVRHAGSGTTSLGFLHSPRPRQAQLLEKTRAVFAAGGLQTEITNKILTKIWAKLFINVGINALTATLDCKNGELLTIPGIDARMRNAIEEAKRIAKAESIEIIDDPYLTTRSVCGRTAENISSMLQDVRIRRRTEIEAINGTVVALGLRHGLQTPENSRLCRQVKELEAEYLRP
jgi:2-dehydropantoate 2-reductase